jgi:hypothetical protein
MKNKLLFLVLILVAAAVLTLSFLSFAQSTRTAQDGGWVWLQFDKPPGDDQPGQPRTVQNKNATPRPTPRHSISGMWYAPSGVQSDGVGAMPNDGKPEHQPPYTPYGLKLYKSHKPLEGYDAIAPGESNDPRDICEPLGFPRANHYLENQTQIFQDDVKVAVLYGYENKWRIIWTDGRELPKLVDGAVQMGEQVREQRFYGYSVGKWVDDTTLVVQTVGTFPDDRVWLDNTGRPISDQIHVTETFHRADYVTLELSETIDDPKIYTKPWATLNKLQMKLVDPRTDVAENYCSPVERQRYYKILADPGSESKPPTR